MLTWEESAALTILTPEEEAAIGGRMPTDDFVNFIIDPYLYAEPLKDRPGIRDFVVDDIAAARRRESYDLSALLKLGIRDHLVKQGYAGTLPHIPVQKQSA